MIQSKAAKVTVSAKTRIEGPLETCSLRVSSGSPLTSCRTERLRNHQESPVQAAR